VIVLSFIRVEPFDIVHQQHYTNNSRKKTLTVGLLRLPFLAQRVQVYVHSFGRQLPLLSFQAFEQLFLPPFTFLTSQLICGYRLSGTGDRVGVMRRPARTLFGVLLFPPLSPSVLKPYLKQKPIQPFSTQCVYNISKLYVSIIILRFAFASTRIYCIGLEQITFNNDLTFCDRDRNNIM
jgi:hypothetical protein